VNCWR